jgi:SAM-dependent methyltransferase
MDAAKRLSALLTYERISDERRTRLRQRVHRLSRPAWLGTIRRTAPLSEAWGRDRGTPVDRYYIEQFLEENRNFIRGRVLEIMNSDYTRRFGQRVETSDVLDIDAQNPAATFVADLAAADGVPSEAFDCVILTQTLQYIFDLSAALDHAHRILRPGGTLLCTVPSVSRIGRKYVESEYWRFTATSCSRLLGHAFPAGVVDVRARGNVLVSVAFLMGMACEELSRRELEVDDPYFPLVITARATRAAARAS